MRHVLSWLVILVILAGGAYLGSPWWTVWNLERAAKAGDARAVGQVVDFPAVRASLSPQLTTQLQSALAREDTRPHTLFEKFTLFASKLFVPKPVDTLVTPEGVTYMIKTAEPPHWSNPFAREHAQPAGQPAMDLMHSGYMADDLDQFHATVANKLAPGRGVSLKLLRRGFITWKVVGLDLIATPTAGTSGTYAPAGATAP